VGFRKDFPSMGQEEKKIHIENDISSSKFINALYRAYTG
jgi:hypothetical protein